MTMTAFSSDLDEMPARICPAEKPKSLRIPPSEV